MFSGGFALGVIHSLDPDHLAAMSIGRASLGGFVVCLCQGINVASLPHTLSLVSAGLFLVKLDGQLSGFWERAFEVGIAALLICFGVMRLRDAWRGLLVRINLWPPQHPVPGRGLRWGTSSHG